MIATIYSCPKVLKRHQDAPLFSVRNQFLAMKSEKGLTYGGLKQWENYLMSYVSDFKLYDGRSTCVTLDDILEKAEAKYGFPIYSDNKLNRNQVKEYYIIRAIDFLDYCGLLDERYYDKTLNVLVSSKHAKIGLIMAPFFKERIGFIKELHSKGYKPCVLREYAQYQLHIIDLLNLKEHREVTEEEILSAAKIWKNHSDINRRKKAGTRCNDTFFVSVAKKWLAFANMYQFEEVSKTICEIRIEHYLQDLRYRGYSIATINSFSHVLLDFYKKIGKQDSADSITLADIDLCLKTYTTGHTSRQTLSTYMNRIRNYLRFAAERGWCQPGLADAVILPRIYQNEKLPTFMPWDKVQGILKNLETVKWRTATRNYTIVLLLATYGLRCSEVARLKLSDIDWQKEQIHIKRAKCGKEQDLPLLHSVGERIIAYLRDGRPNDFPSDYLFFCSRAPFRPITCNAIAGIVRRCMPSDMNIKHKGPHSFRHSYATFLINNGQTMKEVGDLLGHKSIDSTRIYAKVDFTSLREVSNIDFEDLL